MAEHLWLDPVLEDSDNDELDLMAEPYHTMALSAPAPELETVMAGGLGSRGDRIAARGHRTRTVTMTVRVRGDTQSALDAAVGELEAKVAKLAAEGGTLMRMRPDNTFRTLDVLAATSYDRVFDVAYFEGNVAEATIGLMALPYARGSTQTYSVRSEATLPWLIFTEADVLGDVPGQGLLTVFEPSGEPRRTVIWGLESRYRDPAADLGLQAEAGTLASSVASTADATASGGFMARYTSGATSDTFATRVTFPEMAHRGTYRVLVRAKVSHNDFLVRARWQRDGITSVTNAAAAFTAYITPWRLLDLGVVRVEGDRLPWTLELQSTSVTGETLAFDYVLLVPVAEGSGQAEAPDGSAYALRADEQLTISHEEVLGSWSFGVPFSPPYQGDRLWVPPGRDVRVVVLVSRGLMGQDAYGDEAIDDIEAQLAYTPLYLTLN